MKSIRYILPAAGVAVLILDAKTALTGARLGLELCTRTVIPSLLPFLFLSAMLTSSLTGQRIPMLDPLVMLCRIPAGAEGILAVGLIGGYPVGAQSVAQVYQSGQLTKQTAQRMLGFCSNAGPSFIFGILSCVFEPAALWTLWGIHILSALLTGMLLPGAASERISSRTRCPLSPTSALERSIKVMANICCWVILFRVLISFVERWFLWLLPNEIGVLISGLLELTNGCCQLMLIESEGLRFVIASAFLAFGGFCIALQTKSVTKGLGFGLYLPGKGIQAALSTVLACIAQHFLFPAASVIPLPFLLWIVLSIIALTVISKIRSSNLLRQGV